MIAKITNGAAFAGLANYLHGPGKEQEHHYDYQEGGQVIGGNLMVEGDRDGRRWARDMHAAAQQRPDIAKPVWHMSLRAAPEDPRLSDEKWREIAQTHAERMGWAAHPWVMVRHGDDHVHVVVSRVDFNGQVWSRKDDRYKAREACLKVEQQHELRPTALDGPKQDAPRRVQQRTATTAKDRQQTHKLTQGEFRRAERTHVPPERTQVAARVREARAHAVRMGGGRKHFEDALTKAGVEFRANVASTGRMNGYSFHAPGHTDAQGQPVWWKASDLDRSLSWGRLSKELTPRTVKVAVPAVEPKRLMERRSTFEARQQAATVAAHQKFRADSLNKMQGNIAAQGLPARLFWVRRSSVAKEKAKTWALNVQSRAATLARAEETMKTVGAGFPEGRKGPSLTPNSATFNTGVQMAQAAVRAWGDLDERKRGRGVGR